METIQQSFEEPPYDPEFGNRDTCGVCLDFLPLDAGTRTYYACCSKIVCTDCADKCEYIAKDHRCPMCREPCHWKRSAEIS